MRFTVRPVVLLVAGRDGDLHQIWTNLRTRPTAAELDASVVRVGGESGPGAALTPALLAAARHALAGVTFGTPGLVWSA